MIINDSHHILFIEPRLNAETPIIDSITRRVTAAWRNRLTGSGRFRGVHTCTGQDGAVSDNAAEHLIGGFESNSLCIHYVACHRSEVPQAELDKIERLPLAEAEPTEFEIRGVYDRKTDDAEDMRAERRMDAFQAAVISAPSGQASPEQLACMLEWSRRTDDMTIVIANAAVVDGPLSPAWVRASQAMAKLYYRITGLSEIKPIWIRNPNTEEFSNG